MSYCPACRHNFCSHHRAEDFFWIGRVGGRWDVVKGLWERGVAAVSQWILDNPPRFCDGHAREEVDVHASIV